MAAFLPLYRVGRVRAGKAGAVYLWETRAAAEKTYDDAWRRSFIERYGADPSVTYFDTPVIVDNLAGETIGGSPE